jgi:hypothetical protein
VLTI